MIKFAFRSLLFGVALGPLLLAAVGCKSETAEKKKSVPAKVVKNPATGEERVRSEEEQVTVAVIQDAGGWVDQAGETASVDLSGPDISEEAFEKVAYLNKFQQVTVVYARSDNLTDKAMSNFANTPALEDIQITSANVTDEGLSYLSGLKKLHSIYVSDSPITDKGLSSLKELNALATLTLMNTKVTGSGLSHLQGLTNLKTVDLAGSPITNEAVAFLASLPNLEELSLNGTKVTDAGIKSLEGHPKLMTLGLQNTGVTPTGVQLLKSANSELRVYQ